MLCATSESALRYFSAHGVLIWIPEPTAPIARRDRGKKPPIPSPYETMAIEKAVPDKPSGAVSPGGGAKTPLFRGSTKPLRP